MPDEATEFSVNSMVSIFDGAPRVEFTAGEEHTILPVEKAREIGLWLIECAIEAERDAAMMEFMLQGQERTEENLLIPAKMLAAIREHRKYNP